MPKVPRLLLLVLGMLALPWIHSGQASDPPQDQQPAAIRLRRPIALLLADQGKRLLVANRDSGTVAVLDTDNRKVISETRFGRKLSALAATPKRSRIVVTDEDAGELIVVAYKDSPLSEVRRVKVPAYPVGVQVSEDGGLAVVACLWPRQLAVVDLVGEQPPRVIDLPFAPRRLLLVPGTCKVIIADSFGGNLAVVDLRRKAIDSIRNLTVHNIRGLALDREGTSLLIAHQTLNSQGHTTAGDIRNGNLVGNSVRRLSLASVLDPGADILRDDRIYSLGDVERGAGDPAELAESFDGQLVVALAGVNELAIGRPDQAIWTRLAVGARPTALAVDAANRRAYIANTFGDSISVVDLQTLKVVAEIRLGTAPELRAAERGELLFYDAQLSSDAWFSCHSCHTDGHTNGRLNDNLTDGSFGTPKRVLSLLGTGDTGPWAWNGQMADLDSQIRNSMKSTMQGKTPTAEQVRDLKAYLETLAAPPSLLKARGSVDAESFKRGRRVFAQQKCASCHAPPTYTSPKTYDVGLRDEVGGSHFNPPSLRGVSQGGPYFHDNRAVTLEEVFGRHKHQISGKLTNQEVTDLLHFLGTL